MSDDINGAPKRTIVQHKPITSDKQCEHAAACGLQQFDHPVDDTPGLSLRVSDGGTKTWTFRYRMIGSRRMQRTGLGHYPAVSLKDARKRARDLRKGIDDGVDPAASRREQKVADTVQSLAEKWLQFKIRAGRRENYMRDSRNRIARLSPWLLAMKAVSVKRADIVQALEEVAGRGAETETNTTHRLLSAVFKWGVSEGYLESDPTLLLKKRFKDRTRVRSLTSEELLAFWSGLRTANMEEGTRLAIMLCATTAQRPNEITALRRRDLSLAGTSPTLTVPGVQAKNHQDHALPLSHASVALLQTALKLAGPNSEYVFPSGRRRKEDGHVLSASIRPAAPTRALDRCRDKKAGTLFGVPDANLYDLRKTCATWLGDEGFLNDAIGLLLNHRSGKSSSVTAKHYNNSQHMKIKRELVLAWSAYLDKLLQLNSGDADKFAKVHEMSP